MQSISLLSPFLHVIVVEEDLNPFVAHLSPNKEEDDAECCILCTCKQKPLPGFCLFRFEIR